VCKFESRPLAAALNSHIEFIEDHTMDKDIQPSQVLLSRRDSLSSFVNKGDVILFQGDSVVCAGRDCDQVSRSNVFPALGTGYASLVAAQLLLNFPEANLRFFNRGVDRDKVLDLDSRWQVDCLDLKPNVLSILVGSNDFYELHRHGLAGDPDKYEREYHLLVKRTKEALPDVKLVICEPFSLKAGKVDSSWEPVYGKYRRVAKRVANENGARFVPFQSMFDEAVKIAPPSVWAADGVHPTMYGASIMRDWWLKAIEA